MSDRYTRKDAEAAFRRLILHTGNREAERWDDVGGWLLDYAACYGGFVINEVINEHGGIHQPFGAWRRTSRDFCETINFAVNAIHVTRTTV